MVDEPRADVDERARDLGDAAAAPRVWYSGSALAPGMRGPMTPASSAITAAATTAAGIASDGRAAAAPNSTWRVRSWRARSATTATTPVATSSTAEPSRIRSGAERGDEDEQHAARHQRLAACLGPKANVSAMHDTTTIASPASVAQPTP